jgi:cytidylate kinase
MEHLLQEYLEKSLHEAERSTPCGTGPVVTISREFGCPSKIIGQQLTELLNKKSDRDKTPRWRFVSKEIVVNAASELEVKLTDMNYFLSSGGKGMMEDVLQSFSQPYVNKHRIRKTITNVVTVMAQKGYVVIIGRGSVGVLHGCPNAIHIRLQAPLAWRIKEVSKLKGITEKEAKSLAMETDEKRTNLIELMLKKKFNPYLFDLTFNCSTLPKEEIIYTILRLMEAKKMIR